MTDAVRKESDGVAAMESQLQLVRSLMGGTAAMRNAGTKFLPKWPNEEDLAYRTRLSVSTLYPAFSHTAKILAGKPFAKPLHIENDVPSQIIEFCENIDLEGRNLHTFAADLMEDVIADGVTGVLVDFPTSVGARTRAEELSAGLRPYWKRYPSGTILGWKTQNIAGVTTLSQIRLLEIEKEDDGEFGETLVEQVRVLTPGFWRTYRKHTTIGGKEEWQQYDAGNTTLPSIPFTFLYGERKGFGVGKPPLLELAHQNVEHWQSKSDQQNILHVARVPILVLIGAETETALTVGASSAVKLPLGADLKFVEHSGAAIEAGRNDLKDIEERMLQSGAELLVRKPGGPVTATQIETEGEGNKSALQRIAESFEDGIDQCLQFTADWLNLPEGGHATLHKDFGANNLSDASASLLLDLQAAGIISKKRVIIETQRRNILSENFDPEEELDEAGEDGPPNGAIDDGDPEGEV
jgi:hypothetical protein